MFVFFFPDFEVASHFLRKGSFLDEGCVSWGGVRFLRGRCSSRGSCAFLEGRVGSLREGCVSWGRGAFLEGGVRFLREGSVSCGRGAFLQGRVRFCRLLFCCFLPQSTVGPELKIRIAEDFIISDNIYGRLGLLTNIYIYIKLIQEVHRGVKGIVTDIRGKPIANAAVVILNPDGKIRGKNMTSSLQGEYWRILLQGTYRLASS